MVSHSAEARFAAVLLQLAHRWGETSDGATLIQLPLARSDLAAVAGAAPETASRIPAAFRRLGYVRTGRRWVAIAGRAALEPVFEAAWTARDQAPGADPVRLERRTHRA